MNALRFPLKKIALLWIICAQASLTANSAPSDPALQEGSHVVAVNQVGYISDRTKRFTAPLSPDGSPFVVRSENGRKPLFQGTIGGRWGFLGLPAR